MLAEFITIVKSHEGAWNTTCGDIAEHLGGVLSEQDFIIHIRMTRLEKSKGRREQFGVEIPDGWIDPRRL